MRSGCSGNSRRMKRRLWFPRDGAGRSPGIMTGRCTSGGTRSRISSQGSGRSVRRRCSATRRTRASRRRFILLSMWSRQHECQQTLACPGSIGNWRERFIRRPKCFRLASTTRWESMAIQFLGSHGRQFDRIDGQGHFFGMILANNLWSGESTRSRSVWMDLCCD